MDKFLNAVVLFLLMSGLASCQFVSKSNEFVEFKLKCSKGIEPHGICFSKYQGQEIVVCCFWEELTENVNCLQGYDLKGCQLKIPQEELKKCMGSLLDEIKFRRRYRLATRRTPWTLALFDKCIYPNRGYCWPVDFDKLTLANAIWKVPLDHYTDYEKSLEDSISTFDFNHMTFPDNSPAVLAPVFTSSNLSFQPHQFHVWGIGGLDGKELAYYCSPECGNDEKEDFLPLHAFLDFSCRRIAIQGHCRANHSDDEAWQFYESPENFVQGKSCFRYNVPRKFNTNMGYDAFFLSSDIFCFIISGSWGAAGRLGLPGKCHALLYDFEGNRIFANYTLHNCFSSYCGPWQQPWCNLSSDGKQLVLGFCREPFLKTFFAGNPQFWVRVCQLVP